MPSGPFRVIIKPGPKNMLNIFRVTSNSIKPLFTGKIRKGNGSSLVGGGAARCAEVSSYPVMEAPPVHEQNWEASDDGPDLRPGELIS